MSLFQRTLADLTGGLLNNFNKLLDNANESAIKETPAAIDMAAFAIRVWGYFVLLLQEELFSGGMIKKFLLIPSVRLPPPPSTPTTLSYSPAFTRTDNIQAHEPHSADSDME